MSRLSSLWRNLVHKDRVDRELDEEMRAMFDTLVDEKMQAGMPAEQARRAAKLELGGVEPVKQQVREERSGAYLEAFVKDVRYGMRMLRRNAGFTLVVVVSLAAGIGANSAIFSVANALLLRTLPVPDVDSLYAVRYQSRLSVAPRYSYPFFERLRAGFADKKSIAAMSRVARMRTFVGEGGEAETSNVQVVSGEFFSTLQLHPRLGRLLTVDDNKNIGGHPVVVISDAYWHRRFGGQDDVLGKSLSLNGARLTIVGVGPEGFTGVWLENPADAWVPVTMQNDVQYQQNYSSDGVDSNQPWMKLDSLSWLEILVRASRPDGQEIASLNAVFQPQLLKTVDQIKDPQQRKLALDRRLILEPFAHGNSNLRSRFAAPLYALMGMVVLLLLIACANTANLLLARATSRRHEMALRLSIGASRARVICQLLTESVLLGAIAAAVGLAIAPFASELLVRMTIGLASGPLPFSVGVDGRVLGFTVLLSLVCSLLFGLAPAWRATDLSLSSELKAGGRTLTRSGGRLSLGRLLVVAQVALSLLLVVGAGLFLRSFQNLTELPLGFQPEHVLSAAMNAKVGGYKQEDLAALYQRLIERAESLPGVESASVAMCSLMSGCRSNADGLVFEGYQAAPDEQVMVQENHVSPHYFSTVGMRIVAGRDLVAADSADPIRVAVLNEAAVRRYFKGREAVGQRFGYGEKPDILIVGVVQDARVNTVREAILPMAFYPLRPMPGYIGSLDVRVSGDPHALVTSLRRAIAASDPKLPIDRIVSVSDQAGSTLSQERLISRLTTLLSVLALGLSCLGLYGLMSYAVKQRTAELGLRLALGAPRARVLWMVFRESLLLIAVGLAVGLPAVIAASRLVGTILFEVSPNDPATLALAMTVLLIVGAWAGYLPAWRASNVDPLTALKEE